MADNTQFSQEKLDEAITFLNDLKGRAKAAHDAEDVFMMSLYTDLIKVTSPLINRAHARLLREDRAKINRAHKELRAKVRPQLERE